MLDLDCILFKNYKLYLILLSIESSILGSTLTPPHVRLTSALYAISPEQREVRLMWETLHMIAIQNLELTFYKLQWTVRNITYWELYFIKINDQWEIYSIPWFFIILEGGYGSTRIIGTVSMKASAEHMLLNYEVDSLFNLRNPYFHLNPQLPCKLKSCCFQLEN